MFNFLTAEIRFIAFMLMLVPMDAPSTRGTFLPEPEQPSNEQQLRRKMSPEQCVSFNKRPFMHIHENAQVNTQEIDNVDAM